CFASRIADRAIAAQALLEHAEEHGDLAVDVVEDAHFGLARMEPMEASRVLYEDALPGNRHGEEKGIQARVIEPLADVAPCRQDESFLIRRDSRQLILHDALCLGAHPALENDEMASQRLEAAREVLQVVLALGKKDR